MFGQASRSQGVSRTLTGVHIIGGVDIDCNNLLRHKVPDLKTDGGRCIIRGERSCAGRYVYFWYFVW